MFLPQDNCGTCYARLSESKGQAKPLCWERACPVARLMNPGFEPWLIVFAVLADELISKNGLGRDMLSELGHGWTDFETLLVLKRMHVTWQMACADKRESERNRGQGMSGVAGMGAKKR